MLCLLALVMREPRIGAGKAVDRDATFTITSIVHRAPVAARPVAPPAAPHPGLRRNGAPRALAALKPPVRALVRPYRAARAPIPSPGTIVRLAAARSAVSVNPAARRTIDARARLALVALPTPTGSPPSPSPTPTPAPSPTVLARATVTAAAQAPASFSGLFSQNYPPALPSASIVEAIRARLTGHGRIRIEVDDAGRATDVQFTDGNVDEAGERDVRTQLLGVAYVPADCNGLHCEGALEISY